MDIYREAEKENLHFALANFPKAFFSDYREKIQWDQEEMTHLRSCLMKPEHLDWIDRIWESLDRITDRVFDQKKGNVEGD